MTKEHTDRVTNARDMRDIRSFGTGNTQFGRTIETLHFVLIKHDVTTEIEREVFAPYHTGIQLQIHSLVTDIRIFKIGEVTCGTCKTGNVLLIKQVKTAAVIIVGDQVQSAVQQTDI